MPLSFSQLSTYQRCPKQYEFAFVKKLDRPISPGESFGTSMHSTLKKWGEAEMALKNPVSENQLQLFLEAPKAKHQELSLEYLQSLWHTTFSFDGFESRVEADHARKRGEEILELFFEWWKQEQRIVRAVEKGFSVSADEKIITGRFDRVEESDGGVKIIDFKTSGVRSQDSIDADLQLSLYALACEETFQKTCTELSLLFLREDGITELKTTRTPGQLKDALIQIHFIGEGIDSREYHPLPSREKCTQCPYRRVCPYSAV